MKLSKNISKKKSPLAIYFCGIALFLLLNEISSSISIKPSKILNPFRSLSKKQIIDFSVPDSSSHKESLYTPSTHLTPEKPMVCNYCPPADLKSKLYNHQICFGYIHHLQQLLSGYLNTVIFSYNHIRNSIFTDTDEQKLDDLKLTNIQVSEILETGDFKINSDVENASTQFKNLDDFQTEMLKKQLEYFKTLEHKKSNDEKLIKELEISFGTIVDKDIQDNVISIFETAVVKAKHDYNEKLYEKLSFDEIVKNILKQGKCPTSVFAYKITLVNDQPYEIVILFKLQPKISGKQNSVVPIKTVMIMSLQGKFQSPEFDFSENNVYSIEEIVSSFKKDPATITKFAQNDGLLFVEINTASFFDRDGESEKRVACQHSLQTLITILGFFKKIDYKGINVNGHPCQFIHRKEDLTTNTNEKEQTKDKSEKSDDDESINEKSKKIVFGEPEMTVDEYINWSNNEEKKADRTLVNKKNTFSKSNAIINDKINISSVFKHIFEQNDQKSIINPVYRVLIVDDFLDNQHSKNTKQPTNSILLSKNEKNELSQERKLGFVDLSNKFFTPKVFLKLIKETQNPLNWIELQKLYFLLYFRYSHLEFEHEVEENSVFNDCHEYESNNKYAISLKVHGQKVLEAFFIVHHPLLKNTITKTTIKPDDEKAQNQEDNTDGSDNKEEQSKSNDNAQSKTSDADSTSFFCLDIQGKMSFSSISKLFCYEYYFNDNKISQSQLSDLYLKIMKTFVYNYAQTIQDLVLFFETKIDILAFKQYFYQIAISFDNDELNLQSKTNEKEEEVKKLPEFLTLIEKSELDEKQAKIFADLRNNEDLLKIQSINTGVQNRLFLSFTLPKIKLNQKDISTGLDLVSFQVEALETFSSSYRVLFKETNRLLEINVPKFWADELFIPVSNDVQIAAKMRSYLWREIKSKDEIDFMIKTKIQYFEKKYQKTIAGWLKEAFLEEKEEKNESVQSQIALNVLENIHEKSRDFFKVNKLCNFAISVGLLNYIFMGFDFFDEIISDFLIKTSLNSEISSTFQTEPKFIKQFDELMVLFNQDRKLVTDISIIESETKEENSQINEKADLPETDELEDSLIDQFSAKTTQIFDNLVKIIADSEHFDRISNAAFLFSPSKYAGNFSKKRISLKMYQYKTDLSNFLHLSFQSIYFSTEFIYPLDVVENTYVNLFNAIQEVIDEEALREQLSHEATDNYQLGSDKIVKDKIDTFLNDFLKEKKLEENVQFCREDFSDSETRKEGQVVSYYLTRPSTNEDVNNEINKESEIEEQNEKQKTDENENIISNKSDKTQSSLFPDCSNTKFKKLENLYITISKGEDAQNKKKFYEMSFNTHRMQKTSSRVGAAYNSYRFYTQYDYNYEKVFKNNLNKGLELLLENVEIGQLKLIKEKIKQSRGSGLEKVEKVDQLDSAEIKNELDIQGEILIKNQNDVKIKENQMEIDKKRLEELESKMSESDKSIQEITQKIESSTKSITDSTAKIEPIQKEISQIQSQKTESIKKSQNEENNDQSKIEIDELEKSEVEKSQSLENINKEISKLNEEIESNGKEKTTIEENHQKLVEEHAKIKNQIEMLEAEINKESQKGTQVLRQLNLFEHELDEYLNENKKDQLKNERKHKIEHTLRRKLMFSEEKLLSMKKLEKMTFAKMSNLEISQSFRRNGLKNTAIISKLVDKPSWKIKDQDLKGENI